MNSSHVELHGILEKDCLHKFWDYFLPYGRYGHGHAIPSFIYKGAGRDRPASAIPLEWHTLWSLLSFQRSDGPCLGHHKRQVRQEAPYLKDDIWHCSGCLSDVDHHKCLPASRLKDSAWILRR